MDFRCPAACVIPPVALRLLWVVGWRGRNGAPRLPSQRRAKPKGILPSSPNPASFLSLSSGVGGLLPPASTSAEIPSFPRKKELGLGVFRLGVPANLEREGGPKLKSGKRSGAGEELRRVLLFLSFSFFVRGFPARSSSLKPPLTVTPAKRGAAEGGGAQAGEEEGAAASAKAAAAAAKKKKKKSWAWSGGEQKGGGGEEAGGQRGSAAERSRSTASRQFLLSAMLPRLF
ncbi:uncharacterized protein [Anolis sagrei]|uniref:uncharacterized protein n=1 Tax=Anolis sagrei TaxID=38937 RepID=UPI00352165E1